MGPRAGQQLGSLRRGSPRSPRVEVQGSRRQGWKGAMVGEACVLAPVIHVSQGIQLSGWVVVAGEGARGALLRGTQENYCLVSEREL